MAGATRSAEKEKAKRAEAERNLADYERTIAARDARTIELRKLRLESEAKAKGREGGGPA
jgi:hypothetical protein